MQGYLSIPDELLRDTEGLSAWFTRSHDWIGTLDPKPTEQ